MFSQIIEKPLKKRQYGYYEGAIPNYIINEGNILLDVEPVSIRIHLSASNLSLTIGEFKHEGGYDILYTTKSYSVIEIQNPQQTIKDRYLIYSDGKQILKEGIHPQPNSILNKIKS